jgi:hypothetical protein
LALTQHPNLLAQGLMALVATCDAGLSAVRANGLSAVAPLAAHFVPFKSEVEAHLLEEEQAGLPLMRAAFSAQDFKPVEKKMLAHLTPADLAWFLRPFPDDAARRDWMARVLGIPGPVIWLVMMPASKKYQSNVVAPMRALIDGAKEAPPQPASGCACVVM